jgi:transcriptional regulator with XRE-family HTH domain
MLNDALRLIRVFHDLTQKDLAEQLGISKSHLSEIESGKKTPSLPLLDRYAGFFKVPASSIMFFAENMESDQDMEKVKAFVSSKIVALMNFIAERSGRVNAE